MILLIHNPAAESAQEGHQPEGFFLVKNQAIGLLATVLILVLRPGYRLIDEIRKALKKESSLAWEKKPSSGSIRPMVEKGPT